MKFIFILAAGFVALASWCMCKEGSHQDTTASGAWYKHFNENIDKK